jgi:hypothetical protein
MRRICPYAGLLILLASALPLAAQNILGNSAPLQFVPIDTSKAIKPPDMSKFNVIGVKPATPNLAGLFPSLSLTNFPRWPGSGQSTPILTGKNNVLQPNPPGGPNWFNQKPQNAMTIP